MKITMKKHGLIRGEIYFFFGEIYFFFGSVVRAREQFFFQNVPIGYMHLKKKRTKNIFVIPKKKKIGKGEAC